jgi:hypothetical protein
VNNYDKFNEQWQKAKLKLKMLNLYEPTKVKNSLEKIAFKEAERRIAEKYIQIQRVRNDE